MGVYTSLGSSTGEEPPQSWFSKSFVMVVHARPGETWRTPRPLSADLARAIEPLTRVVDGEQEPLEDFLERDPTAERRAYWEQQQAEREAAWQAPADMLVAVEAALTAIRIDPEPWFACGVLDQGFYDADHFTRDLEGLRRDLQWALGRGIPLVRLEQG
jgi:hypothetical protein